MLDTGCWILATNNQDLTTRWLPFRESSFIQYLFFIHKLNIKATRKAGERETPGIKSPGRRRYFVKRKITVTKVLGSKNSRFWVDTTQNLEPLSSEPFTKECVLARFLSSPCGWYCRAESVGRSILRQRTLPRPMLRHWCSSSRGRSAVPSGW